VTDRIRISRSGGVADVRLNRADKLNALDPAMFTALVDAADELAADRSVRAVVLSGEGRGFCAGLDLSSVQAIAGGDAGGGDDEEAKAGQAMSQAARSLTDRMPGRITNLFQEVAHGWTALAVPVIAACAGPVLGGGLQIALGADIRFTTPDAKWSVLEIRWGLLPDMTGVQNLVRLVGLDIAKELVFTGRMVSGTEAVELGIATHVADDPHAEAMALAEEIAGKNPHAIRGMKALLNAAGTRPLVDSYIEESRLMESRIGSPNQVEATMAFFEKRQPNFVDP
jgi:enoyl-CoA hydratase/carnithine racemase